MQDKYKKINVEKLKDIITEMRKRAHEDTFIWMGEVSEWVDKLEGLLQKGLTPNLLSDIL